jgi:hypothetical protein
MLADDGGSFSGARYGWYQDGAHCATSSDGVALQGVSMGLKVMP